MPLEYRPNNEVESDEHLPNAENANLDQVALTVQADMAKPEVCEDLCEDKPIEGFHLSENARRSAKLGVFLMCIGFLVIGRYSVPDNETSCVQDRIMSALQFANDFINANGNEIYRDMLQILCSLLVDTVFIITFGYWVIRGTGGRLPVTLAIFYITRALVQNVWYSPFPQGFYWNSPGLPSLVVPYGRGSDFFFSGHTGFLVICASEWHKLNFPKVRNFVLLTCVYTVTILLTYRIHYSIDIFTGLFFAEWCFTKIHQNKEQIDGFVLCVMNKLGNFLGKKQGLIRSMGKEVIPLVV